MSIRRRSSTRTSRRLHEAKSLQAREDHEAAKGIFEELCSLYDHGASCNELLKYARALEANAKTTELKRICYDLGYEAACKEA